MKKESILYIYEILKKYSNENNKLSAKQIDNFLKKDYQIAFDRKSIKNNLIMLVEMGKNIEYREQIRSNGQIVQNDWYYYSDFTNGELRLVCDSLVYNKYIDNKMCKQMIQKMQKLSNNFDYEKNRYIRQTGNQQSTSNKQLVYSVDILNEAILLNRKVKFNYVGYNSKQKLECKRNDENQIREYIINPYYLVTNNGRYYLVCNNEKYDDISSYRVDRIKNIEIIDSQVKPILKGFDINKFMQEHIYMYSGKSINAQFIAPTYMIDEIIDWYGSSAKFSTIDENNVLVNVKVNEKAFVQWAMQYVSDTKVTSPDYIKKQIKERLEKSINKYK